MQTLHHYESKSRGFENTPEKQERFNREIAYFQSKWEKELEVLEIRTINRNQTLHRAGLHHGLLNLHSHASSDTIERTERRRRNGGKRACSFFYVQYMLYLRYQGSPL